MPKACPYNSIHYDIFCMRTHGSCVRRIHTQTGRDNALNYVNESDVWGNQSLKVSIFHTVRVKIFRSSSREKCSTYSMSACTRRAMSATWGVAPR